MTDETPSPTQKRLAAIAETVLDGIAVLAGKLPEMSAADAKSFTEAARDAYWFLFNAEVHDKRVELELARTQWSD